MDSRRKADWGVKLSEALSSRLSKLLHSQLPKCPKCNSEYIWRDGLRYLSDGRAVQRWLCRSCGFRFSKTTTHSKVKLNVPCQIFEKPDSGKNFLQPYVFERKLPVEPAIEDSSLKLREDITSHSLSRKTITEKKFIYFS
ncbi:MAG: hypothetical protein QXO15_08180 [Nitrososphaerota archaeon]